MAALAAGLAAVLAVLALGGLLAGTGRAGLTRRPRARPLAALRAALARRAGVPAPLDLAARLDAAGVRGTTAAQVMAVKCALAAGAGLLALLAARGVPPRAGAGLIALAPAAAFLAPDLLLARRARRRAARLRAGAPDVLDRVRLAARAGMAPWRALAAGARHGDGDLEREVRAAVGAVRLGEPRAAALDRLRRRCPVPEVEALAAALARCDRHGAPLAPALERLAAGARAERARRVRERAQRAAPKIQLVVALALVPAAMLLLAAGMLAGLRP